MKVIKRKISLEQFKSRTPSMIDFIDGDKTIHFDKNNEETLNYIYPNGNYNYISCDLIIDIKNQYAIDLKWLTPVSSFTNNIVSYSDVIYDSTNICNTVSLKYYVIPYGTLKKMYFFFNEYHALLRDRFNCDNMLCHNEITSATLYWEYYVKDIDLKQQYVDMDNLFKSYGGAIDVDNGKIKYKGFNGYLVNKVFKTFTIPSEYTEYWKTTYLYYIDALNWYNNYFIEKYKLYSAVTSCTETEEIVENCEKTIHFKYDCCDCSEYFARGGNIMYRLLKTFLEEENDIKISSATTSLDLQIFIDNTIDDIGEYSIFSEDWVGGRNYESDICGGQTYTKCGQGVITGGTIVSYGNDVLLKKCDNNSGSIITPCKTFGIDPSSWIPYLSVHTDVLNLGDIDNPSLNYYTYNANNEIVILTKEQTYDNAYKVAIKQTLIKNEFGFILMEKSIYAVNQYEYVHNTVDKKYYIVERDDYGKFVLFNGKKFRVKNNNTVNFYKIPHISEGYDFEVKTDNFVLYNSEYYIVENSYVTINDFVYQVFNSYFTLNNNIYPIVDGNISTVLPNKFVSKIEMFPTIYEIKEFGDNIKDETKVNNTTFGYTIKNDEIIFFNPYEIYDFNSVSGITSSKLDILKSKHVFTDDMGNPFNGVFNITSESTYIQPLEGTCLDIPYKVNNTARLSYNEDTKKYWGDILKEIVVYYEDVNKQKTSQQFSASTNGFLDAVKNATDDWTTKWEYQNNDNLRCEFIYHIGATFNSAFTLSDNGVTYIDKATLYKTPTIFNLDKTTSYNIYYYDIVFDTLTTSYEKKRVTLPKSEFSFQLTMEDYINRLTLSPIIKEEYKLGISTIENVQDNIYIERPIIKPTEKYLQLLDIVTLEAMEKYGNGLIKIINNN